MALAACTSDPAAHPTTTTVRDTVAATAVSSSTSTTSSTTTTTTTTTTSAPTTTISAEDQLKAQISADYVGAFWRRWELRADPTLDGLDAKAAEIAVPGSESYAAFVTAVTNLARVGDRVVANDPDLTSVTIEKVALSGAAPYTEAIVTVCEVDNRKAITPPENSPTGSEIVTPRPHELFAFRTDEPVRLTDKGWLPFRYRRDGQVFEGATACPAP